MTNTQTLAEKFEVEFKPEYIIFDGNTYAYTETQKKKLVKKLVEYHGKKQMTEEVKEAFLHLKKKTSISSNDVKSNPTELLFDYIIPNKNIRYDDVHEALISNVSGFEISDDNLETFISTANDEYCKMVGKDGLTWKDKVVFNQFKEFKINAFHEGVGKIRKDIKFNGDENSDSVLDELLDELLDAMNISHQFYDASSGYKTDNYRSVCKLAIKQLFWLVKRNLFNLPTKNQLMIFFLGAQGIGKSYAFDKLFKTIFKALYISDCKLSTLLEEREVELWTRKLLINFDDASVTSNSFNNKSMGEVRQKLSGNTITYRPMGSNESRTLTKKFTAVSTTNVDFKELIQDNTGARRFFQLISDNETNEKFDVNYFDGDDIDEKVRNIWLNVDENNNDGYLFNDSEDLVTLGEIQLTYVKLDTQTVFQNEMGFAVNSKEVKARKKISFTTAYQKYVEFCSDNHNSNVKQRNTFSTSLAKDVYFVEEKLSNGRLGKFCFIEVFNEDANEGTNHGFTKYKTNEVNLDNFDNYDDDDDDDNLDIFGQ